MTTFAANADQWERDLADILGLDSSPGARPASSVLSWFDGHATAITSALVALAAVSTSVFVYVERATLLSTISSFAAGPSNRRPAPPPVSAPSGTATPELAAAAPPVSPAVAESGRASTPALLSADTAPIAIAGNAVVRTGESAPEHGDERDLRSRSTSASEVASATAIRPTAPAKSRAIDAAPPAVAVASIAPDPVPASPSAERARADAPALQSDQAALAGRQLALASAEPAVRAPVVTRSSAATPPLVDVKAKDTSRKTAALDAIRLLRGK